jgi:cysteinyl-tRNA synthetase
MHANMLTMNSQRMSKSTGNYILPMQLVTEKTISSKSLSILPSFVSAFCRHYRSVLDISNDAMIASEKGYTRLMEAIKVLDSITPNDEKQSGFSLEEWKNKAYDALTDDFNSPVLIAHLFEAVKYIFALNDGKETISTKDLDDLKSTLNALVFDLGLQTIEENNNEKLDQTLKVLIELRNQARKSKNFELSDQIRDASCRRYRTERWKRRNFLCFELE